MFTYYKLLLNLLGNYRVQVAVQRGPRLLLSMLFTMYGYFVISRGLGLNLSKHDFDMQEIDTPVLNNETV